MTRAACDARLLTGESQLAASSTDMARVLNLGSGKKYIPGVVNVDVTPATKPDVVHDLNRVPWPFSDSYFREVQALDVLEHLSDLIAVMEEIHRICEDGAIIRVTTPHFSSANSYTDLTHRHHFGFFSLDHFTGASSNDFYTGCRFRMISRKILFHPSLVNKLVWRLASRNPELYERSWAWAFPAWFLYFELAVSK
jgi:SAM-dependent methyltransferase